MLYVNSLVLDYPACVSFKEVIKRLAESGSDGKLWSDAKGELLRELDRFDESVEMLEKAREEQPDMGWLIDQIQEHAKNHDWKIFEITNVKI